MAINKRGFTMFFAVLVSALTLAIGVAIYDLVVRQLALTQTVAQSQYAFTAADTGAECALYWDAKYPGGNFFPTSSASTLPTAGTALCNGYDIGQATYQQDPTMATTSFSFSMGTTTSMTNPCVSVQVGKSTDSAGVLHTLIISDGYNNGYSNCAASSGNQVQRELQTRY